MENLRKQLAELEAEAAEASLIADLATDSAARAAYTKLAQSLSEALEGLRLEAPDRQFLLLQAEKCRSMAVETADRNMQAHLRSLASEFEAKAQHA
jgi:hypothetical protein